MNQISGVNEVVHGVAMVSEVVAIRSRGSEKTVNLVAIVIAMMLASMCVVI